MTKLNQQEYSGLFGSSTTRARRPGPGEIDHEHLIEHLAGVSALTRVRAT
jgi:hypothetical protein